MPTVHLSKIMKDFGVTSVRDLLNKTGSSEQSVFKQAQIAAIDSLYRENQSFRGPLGFPIGEVEFNDGDRTAERKYAAGWIRFQSDNPEGESKIVVRVRFVGFHCHSESDWDGGSDLDEPYFIIGVAAANGSNTVRFGPYEKINSGDNRYEASYILSEQSEITPPIVLGVVVMEHDYGTPQEAETKVRKVVEAIEKKFDQGVGMLTGTSGDSHVLPEWSRDILIGWLPEGIAAVFGMGDDRVGSTPVVLFDNKADLEEWRAPAILGKHGPNEYNVVININGGDEGNYDTYFKVDLFKVTRVISPLSKS